MVRLLEMLKVEYLDDITLKSNKGLCDSANNLYNYDKLSHKEYLQLDLYMTANSPETHPPADIDNKLDTYEWYWFPLEDIESRVAWLDKHIELNSNQI